MWRVRFLFLIFFSHRHEKTKHVKCFFPFFGKKDWNSNEDIISLLIFFRDLQYLLNTCYLLLDRWPFLARDEDIDSYWQQMDRKRSRREWQQSKFLLWTCLDYWNIDIFMFSQKIIFVYQNFLYFPRIWAKWRINLSLSEGALMLSVTLTTPRDQETREISTSKAPQNLKRVI